MSGMSFAANSILSVSSASTVKLGAEQVNVNQEIARLIIKPGDSPNRIYFKEHFSEVPAASTEEEDKSNQRQKIVFKSDPSKAVAATAQNAEDYQQMRQGGGGIMPNSTQAHEARAAGMEENKEELEQKISQMTLQSDASMTSSQISQGAQQALMNNPESDSTSMSSDQPTLIPGNKPLGQGGIEVRISDFIAYEMLGQGAGGVVKKAIHRPTKKVIALKEIPFQQDEKLRKQILIELKTLHDCDCDNVLRSYGAFEKEGKVNIALEFMDAGSLAHILKSVGQIPEAIIGLLTVQIL